jgi:hypothetical protein
MVMNEDGETLAYQGFRTAAGHDDGSIFVQIRGLMNPMKNGQSLNWTPASLLEHFGGDQDKLNSFIERGEARNRFANPVRVFLLPASQRLTALFETCWDIVTFVRITFACRQHRTYFTPDFSERANCSPRVSTMRQ